MSDNLFLKLDYEDEELVYYPMRAQLQPKSKQTGLTEKVVTAISSPNGSQEFQANYQQMRQSINPVSQKESTQNGTCTKGNAPYQCVWVMESVSGLIPVQDRYKKKSTPYDNLTSKLTYRQ